MSALLKFEQTARWQECCNCGITFGLLSSWATALQNSHKTFYCPNGHPQNYTGPSEAEKLRKELDRERALRETAEKSVAWERHAAKNARTQLTKARNKLAKVVKRVHAGVCPHCNRTFKQLAAHMKCKHGDQLEPAKDEPEVGDAMDQNR